MALTVGSTPVKKVYVGSTPIQSVYVGSQKVWSAKEVVQITLGTGYQARDQFRAALTARGLDYRAVTEIPFDIKLVGTGVTDHMFEYCSNLTAVPALNTSGSTSMKYMFRDCKNLKEAPAMDTSNVTDMTQMFYKCSSMTYVPDMHTSQASVMGHMFFGCSALTDGNVRLIGKHPNVNTNLMIYLSGLTREPFYTTDGTPLAPREVTILSDMGGFAQSATGDTDLVSGWPYAMAYGPAVTFAAPVTCNRAVRIIDERDFGVGANAGTTIFAGTVTIPGDYSSRVAYVFTEVL